MVRFFPVAPQEALVLDTVRGLPTHVLLLHATVVLVPVTCLVTVVVAFWPRIRALAAWPVVALNAVMVVMVWLTAQAGQRLAARLGQNPEIAHHASLGQNLIWFAVGLLVTSVLVALLHRRGGALRLGTGLLATVVAVATLTWCFRVGESGATAVWQSVVANTTAGG
jgi:Ca2+/Na+ antiporter